ncbi:hypothetical protein KVR01_007457 [Diaporthe batatas]|uniref:uncharacterized protein n=1 Tax=Diaporthe batatas TaxID=748121 RepID=UPI001D05618B|nr:uncharacterized protein KVR01_007457 [Diaporthe batatas]KAG8162979.1 hypothetical protein KVR01_007457 [Diaporthe batatas]
MQFSAAVLALAASVAAQKPVFEISDFSAACVAHGSECIYEFGLFQSGGYQTEPQHCRAQVQTTDGTLPEVLDGTCEATSRTWTVTKADGGLVLEVTQQVTPASNTTGKHAIPASELELVQAGASGYQQYTGPKEFGLFY